MKLLDEEYTRHPFKGTRRLTDFLNDNGYPVGRDKTRSLMRRMGVEAIYPKPRLSAANTAHKRYPYLLRKLNINRPDQVWCSDITYIRLKRGFAYLVAVMDWHSRYVIDWELSLSLDSDFCVRTLQRSLARGQPEIFNTDQGSQFTSIDFTKTLADAGVKISMDGKGRAFDNIMIERLWRTVKYEEVYLKDYRDLFCAREYLSEYFEYYNMERRHSSLEKRTPWEVYNAERNISEAVA